jgi:hypothetical protein
MGRGSGRRARHVPAPRAGSGVLPVVAPPSNWTTGAGAATTGAPSAKGPHGDGPGAADWALGRRHGGGVADAQLPRARPIVGGPIVPSPARMACDGERGVASVCPRHTGPASPVRAGGRRRKTTAPAASPSARRRWPSLDTVVYADSAGPCPPRPPPCGATGASVPHRRNTPGTPTALRHAHDTSQTSMPLHQR